MNHFHPLATTLWLAKWLTSLGVYLAFVGMITYEPTKKTLITWIETHPISIICLLVSMVWAHHIFEYWERSVKEKNRRVSSQEWAHRYRWNYTPHEDRALFHHYRFLYGIPGYAVYKPKRDQRRRYPCATHTLRRRWKTHQAIAFTQYSRSMRRRSSRNKTQSTQHSYLAITILETQKNFPKLFIRPQHWSDHFFRLFTSSAEKLIDTQQYKPLSSQKFVVHSSETKKQKKYWAETRNPEFSEEFLHEDMKQKLSELPPKMTFEIDKGVLVLFQEGKLNLETLHENLDYLDEIYQLIPSNLMN